MNQDSEVDVYTCALAQHYTFCSFREPDSKPLTIDCPIKNQDGSRCTSVASLGFGQLMGPEIYDVMRRQGTRWTLIRPTDDERQRLQAKGFTVDFDEDGYWAIVPTKWLQEQEAKP